MNKIDKLAATLKNAGESKKTSAYDTSAKVIRVDGNTAYVNIPGGVAETPASMVVNAKAGEEVRVRVSGGKAYVTGNATSPPTDDTLAQRAENNAIRAQNAADSASRDAKTAKVSADSAVKDAGVAKESADSAVKDAARAYTAAESAQASATAANTAAQEAKADASTAHTAADNALRGLATVEDVVDVLTWITEHGIMTSQAGGTFVDGQVYFVVDPNGDYEVGGTRYSVVQNPVASDIDNYYVLSVDEAVTNYVATHIAVDAEGLWLIPEDNVTPANSSRKILIAVGGNNHTYPTAGTYIIGKTGNPPVDTVLAKFTDGSAVVGEESSGKSRSIIDANGMRVIRKVGSSDIAVAHLGYGEGYDDREQLENAPYFTFGVRGSSSIGNYSVAEGDHTIASGYSSHAEGNDTTASKYSSHAEGDMTIASGGASHAEGNNARATAGASHAEGDETEANGVASHAEGKHTRSNGDYSHSGGYYTTAGYDYQTVIGKYNNNKSGDLFEIGNGTGSSAKSNAFEVASDGNIELALSTTAASGTDHDLYAAITALGWQSTVID